MTDRQELAARIEALAETGEEISLDLHEWRAIVSALRYTNSSPPSVLPRLESDFA